ncbi:response regulator receiver modulated metal dependent phosphohydrolase [Thermosinus carboxydivorans Nor1]|uniref:Response regulator receiver modulated metal dependent phosphohydrolase n=1 Tax=Thermosinus carboxydivorans Nor1 TaxID=401526 RepID=A1HSJ6_9FIRM|nr:HD domain-containing phosphohydrolase [Thermosinus carboxydivorans]EAX46968.1 response regulator receiver modulated metal dependent phosphohydrolase [Thermosinus carboxydivorans Nor1]
MNAKAKILVIEDDARSARLMEALLMPAGYEVQTVGSGAEGLAAIETFKPHLVLLDIMLPDIDGFEVLRRLKAEPAGQAVPVVMVTALADAKSRARGFELGADDFIIKPVEKIELYARVRSLLRIKAYYDQLQEQNQRLAAEVAERTRELEQALEQVRHASLETIYRLCRAAEYRDEDTGQHLRRISHYVAAIARQLGLDAKTCDLLHHAAPLHDVGKIAIPDHILQKPGPLNEYERQLMQQHTVIGARILEGSELELIETGRIIALSHHERWDGAGYPYGLAGEAIPLAGRIVAVADVFDALRQRRPYKQPLPLEQVLVIMRQERGRHFDPAVVDAFLAILPEIREIEGRYSELLPDDRLA